MSTELAYWYECMAKGPKIGEYELSSNFGSYRTDVLTNLRFLEPKFNFQAYEQKILNNS